VILKKMSETTIHKHEISDRHIDFSVISKVLSAGCKLSLSASATERIRRCREWLDKYLTSSDEPVYGINTGFGALYNTSIAGSDLGKLQVNLVMSHACGTGDEVPRNLTRLMLFLKAQGLSYGNSGVQEITVQRLIDFYNYDIIPVVFQQGSLGASGDLAPLAHISLALLGKGEVYYKGARRDASDVLERHNWKPIELKSKEGLALLNGTQFMSAYGSWCIVQAQKLMAWADVIGALSLEAFDGRIEPFHHLVHEIRPHKGQIETALRFRRILAESKLISAHKTHVQDPYSFRCIPQVHGASRDSLDYAASVFFNEINSVTDNPTLFPDADLIISAGNFHGQPLALALDFLAIALSEIGSISERRTYQLISGQRGLPPFLVKNPGLNSGFMIPQYTAASMVSQNKQLCTPASVDSIVSSNGQEDHVSMGANAATKAYRVVENVKRILAIELYTACQALEFRNAGDTSPYLNKIFDQFRQTISMVETDRIMSDDITKAVSFIEEEPPVLP
jgi:histidine ammonia-lyase